MNNYRITKTMFSSSKHISLKLWTGIFFTSPTLSPNHLHSTTPSQPPTPAIDPPTWSLLYPSSACFIAMLFSGTLVLTLSQRKAWLLMPKVNNIDAIDKELSSVVFRIRWPRRATSTLGSIRGPLSQLSWAIIPRLPRKNRKANIK